MQRLTEMTLPYLPAERPEFDADPMYFVEAARRQHPWLAKFSQGYFVYGYQAVADLARMDDNLRTSFEEIVDFYGAQGTGWGQFMQDHILAICGPKHERIRNSIAMTFAPRTVSRFRSMMRERISTLLDEWAPQGKLDFAELASYYPISVLCGLLGISTDAIAPIRDALETLGKAFSLNRELLPDLVAGYEVLWSYADSLILQREKNGSPSEETFLDSLIATKNAGQMDDLELRYLLLILLLAGYDTSKNMLTLLVYTLIKRPGHWERCAEDQAYCTKVVEEALRHTSIVSIFRTVTQEFVYENVQFPKGVTLVLAINLVGQDPTAFPDGEQFHPERVHMKRHLAFGRGSHSCLGQHLARAQIIEGMHTIAQRITKPRLAGEVKWRAFLGTWGPSSLPIEFEPARARRSLAETEQRGSLPPQD